MTFIFTSPQEAIDAVGRKLGPSDWIPIDQERIDAFARATGDFQWIHVDAERAKAGPFGGCIAHGYLTMSLINMVLPDLIMPENLTFGVNYGCDRVRFPAPVPVNARVRAHGELIKAEAVANHGVQTTIRITMEIEGAAKPGCVADTLQRYYFKSA